MLQKEGECKISHSLRMMANLEDLLKSNIVCDFLINIGSSSFPTHKAVLAACSEYFRTILAEGIDQGVVYINGVSPDAMEQCIRFMYSGEADITLENLESVLNAADLFQIEVLVDLCYLFIQNNISSSNCLDIRNMVVVFENKKLRETVDSFIVDKMNEVVDTATFKKLHKQDMKYFLKMWRSKQRSNSAPSGDLRSATHTPRIFVSAPHKSRTGVASAKSSKSLPTNSKPRKKETKSQNVLLWKGVLSWVSFDPCERRAEFLELLRFIKVTRFSIEFLATVVWNEMIVSDNNAVKEYVASKVLSNIGEVKASLNVRNCLNIFHMVTTYCEEFFDRLLRVVTAFVADNLKKVKKRPEIELWRFDQFCLFFKTCDCSTLEEEDIWDTALAWLRSDKERESHLLDILKVLNFESFTPKFVISFVLREPVVKESAECVEYIAEIVLKDPRHIIWNTTTDTCFTLKYLSRVYKDTIFASVEKDLVSFLIVNFLKIIENPEFGYLTFEEVMNLGKILRKRNVHGEAKWQAIMKWVKHDPDLRRQHLPDLLSTISFDRLTSDFLRETVRKEVLIKSNDECREIVMSAVYKKLP